MFTVRKDLNLSEYILFIEKKYNLLDENIESIQIYPLIRMGLYYKLSQDLNYYSPQPIKKYELNIINIYRLLKHFLMFNDLKKMTTNSIGIIEHPRLIDNNETDIYSHFLNKILNATTISHPLYGKQIAKNDTENFIYYDYYLLKKKLINIFYTNKNINNYAKRISDIINKEFGIKKNYKKFLVNLIKDRITACHISYSFLKRTNIKKLVVVNAYGFNHFIWAAKKLNIMTIELQHGIISDLHLGYHYPTSDKNTIDAFPDYLLTFGDYWNNLAKFPINDDKVIPNGYFYFNDQKSKYLKLKTSNQKKILVISQSTIGEKLSNEIIEIAKELEDYQIIYKLHPKEIMEKPYYLKKLNQINNIKISTNTPLYSLFAECEWQIGVFSTALYEGLGFGLKTIIMKISGWQNLKSLNVIKGVKFLSNSNEVIETINKNIAHPNSKKFFSENSYQKHTKFFKNL
ncbi:hypothetical protein OA856_01005 [Pelagibacteraceae bacterium]|nr:hypothetical protein [Pelagibacteraceae bacterium]